jgi:outer membrane lipoprotein-sorting protein
MLLLAVASLCHPHQDAARTAGLEIWRKSLSTGEDIPMRAEMLMTQRRHGKTITTHAHIIQGAKGRYRMEYVLPAEARGRVVFSDGKSNWQYEPKQNILARTNMVAMSEQRDREAEQLIESNYNISLVSDKASAADRQAYMLDLIPVHAGKSRQRRWIDRKTYKTLRIETHYTDGILARLVSYTQVLLPATVLDSDFTPTGGPTVRRVSAGGSSFYLATHSIPSSFSGLMLKPLAALGFQLIEISSSEIDNKPATQLLYSDGIETVSVFAQSGAAAVSSLPANWARIDIGSETAFQNIDGHLDALTWNHAGYRYTAVSHLTPASLKSFVESQL